MGRYFQPEIRPDLFRGQAGDFVIPGCRAVEITQGVGSIAAHVGPPDAQQEAACGMIGNRRAGRADFDGKPR